MENFTNPFVETPTWPKLSLLSEASMRVFPIYKSFLGDPPHHAATPGTLWGVRGQSQSMSNMDLERQVVDNVLRTHFECRCCSFMRLGLLRSGAFLSGHVRALERSMFGPTPLAT